MPHQLAVTIRAMVAAEQVADLRKWLAASAPQGLADGPFHFRRMRGLHFAKLFLIEQTDDLEGRPIPASLVLMTEVDAPLRRHLDELIDVAGDGIDQAFGYCTGYPGPAARRRARIGWLRRHLVQASAAYVNTVGRGLRQIRQEAYLRDVLEDYLDQADWTGRAPAAVRRNLQAYVAGRADLAWAMKPAAPPSLAFRVREAVNEVAVPLALVPLLPALAFALPAWAIAVAPGRAARHAGHRAPDAAAPRDGRELRGLHGTESFRCRGLRQTRHTAARDDPRGDVCPELCGPAHIQRPQPGRDNDDPFRPVGTT